MTVIAYSDKYLLSLIDMMYNYYKEVHGNKLKGDKNTIETIIADFKVNKSIYLIVGEDNKPKGFFVAYLGDEYGMIDSFVTCEIAYIKPPYRSTIATFYLTYHLSEICHTLGMGIRTNLLLSSSSYTCFKKVDATEIGSITYIPPEDVTKIYTKYKRRIHK